LILISKKTCKVKLNFKKKYFIFCKNEENKDLEKKHDLFVSLKGETFAMGHLVLDKTNPAEIAKIDRGWTKI
jgi:hypothetical protein